MTIRLITVDMDQTFLRADKSYDKDRFRKLFSAFEDRGGVFAVASGNAYYNLDHYFDADILPKIYFCGDDGNFIIKDQKKLAELSLDPDLIDRLIRFLSQYEDTHQVIASTGDWTFATLSDDPFVKEKMSIYYFQSEYYERVEDYPREGVNRMTLLGKFSLEENKAIMDEINRAFPELEAVTPGDQWINIYDRRGGKGSAIAYLQEAYQIKAEESIAFGDSLNDRSMMSEVKYSCAMDNADPELFESCTYRIGNNEDQAVLDVMEQILTEPDMSFMEAYRI